MSDKRLIQLVDLLKNKKVISTDKEFCLAIGIDPANYIKIKKAEKYPKQNYHFSAQQLQNAGAKFNIDMNYLFGFSDNPFRK